MKKIVLLSLSALLAAGAFAAPVTTAFQAHPPVHRPAQGPHHKKHHHHHHGKKHHAPAAKRPA